MEPTIPHELFTWNFDIVISVCYESKGCVLSGSHFVTVEVIFRVPVSNISALATKDILKSKSRFSPTISVIFRQLNLNTWNIFFEVRGSKKSMIKAVMITLQKQTSLI